MTRKSLGYVELEWTCKRCGTKNPGLQKTCTHCGAPMEAADQFELPADQTPTTEGALAEAAQKGADIHCPYCGARNPGGSQVCTQCGGDLSEGALRAAGRVLGAPPMTPTPQIRCPYCNAEINASEQRCPQCGGDLLQKAPASVAQPAVKPKLPAWVMLVGVALFLLCFGGLAVFAILSARTEAVRAQVQDVAWQRSIAILEQRLVEDAAWDEDVPAGAQNVTCRQEYRSTSPDPAPNSTEVCGTPYTIDSGSGVGEVVQDCEYQVYDSYCEYQTLQWVVVSQASVQGEDLQPYWPTLQLQGGQREGERQERYWVTFLADGKQYRFETSDPALFSQFVPGSEWTLEVNTLGGITEVRP